jgi:hypothetical protein
LSLRRDILSVGVALDARAADVRNQLIELKDQAVAAAKRGGGPFLRG